MKNRIQKLKERGRERKREIQKEKLHKPLTNGKKCSENIEIQNEEFHLNFFFPLKGNQLEATVERCLINLEIVYRMKLKENARKQL